MLEPVVVRQEDRGAVPQAVLAENPVQPGLLPRAQTHLIQRWPGIHGEPPLGTHVALTFGPRVPRGQGRKTLIRAAEVPCAPWAGGGGRTPSGTRPPRLAGGRRYLSAFTSTFLAVSFFSPFRPMETVRMPPPQLAVTSSSSASAGSASVLVNAPYRNSDRRLPSIVPDRSAWMVRYP